MWETVGPRYNAYGAVLQSSGWRAVLHYNASMQHVALLHRTTAPRYSSTLQCRATVLPECAVSQCCAPVLDTVLCYSSAAPQCCATAVLRYSCAALQLCCAPVLRSSAGPQWLRCSTIGPPELCLVLVLAAERMMKPSARPALPMCLSLLVVAVVGAGRPLGPSLQVDGDAFRLEPTWHCCCSVAV